MVKVPLWENAPGALAALINTGKFVYSTLITISFNSSDEYVPHQITQPSTTVNGPDTNPIEGTWHPDGEHLVYASISEGIKSVKLDGSGNIILANRIDYGNNVIAGPTISPDGTKIAFVEYGLHASLWVMNGDGTSPSQVFVDTGDLGLLNPNWGSNNKIIYRVNGGDLWTINPDGSGAAFLFTPPTSAFNPKYSPNSTRLLWYGKDFFVSPNTHALWVSDADGSNPKQLITFIPDGWVETPSWSSDGSKIIFSGNAEASNAISGSGIWIMNSDGTNPHKILTTVAKYGPYEGYDRDGFAPKYAAISGDFRWISYFLYPRQDLGLVGIWVFKVPVPLALREGFSVSQSGALPVDNIYLTDADTNISLYAGSPEWDSRTVLIDQENSQINAHWKRGLDVDQAIVVFNPRIKDPVTSAPFPDKIRDTPWVSAARSGVFNGVDVQIDRAYFAKWPPPLPQTITPVGVLTIFAGSAVEVDATDTSVVMTLNDYRELFSTMIPPDVYEGQCKWTLFDAGCKLLAANFKDAGSLIAGSTRATLLTTSVTPLGSGTYAQGKIRMLGGLNRGFVRTISEWDPAVPNRFGLLNPFPFAVAEFEDFEIYPGCNKTVATCVLFGNKDNHGGYTTIPTATSAI